MVPTAKGTGSAAFQILAYQKPPQSHTLAHYALSSGQSRNPFYPRHLPHTDVTGDKSNIKRISTGTRDAIVWQGFLSDPHLDLASRYTTIAVREPYAIAGARSVPLIHKS
jgi:hypothetical protein